MLPEVATLGAMAALDGQSVQATKKDCDPLRLPFETVILNLVDRSQLEVGTDPVRAGQPAPDEGGDQTTDSREVPMEVGLQSGHLLGSVEALGQAMGMAPPIVASDDSLPAELAEVAADLPTLMAGREPPVASGARVTVSPTAAPPEASLPLPQSTQAVASAGDVEVIPLSDPGPAAASEPRLFDTPAQAGQTTPADVSNVPAPPEESGRIEGRNVQGDPGQQATQLQISVPVGTRRENPGVHATVSKPAGVPDTPGVAKATPEELPAPGAGPKMRGTGAQPAGPATAGASRSFELPAAAKLSAGQGVEPPVAENRPTGRDVELPAEVNRPIDEAAGLRAGVNRQTDQDVRPPAGGNTSRGQHVRLPAGVNGPGDQDLKLPVDVPVGRTVFGRGVGAIGEDRSLGRSRQSADPRLTRAVGVAPDVLSGTGTAVERGASIPVTRALGLESGVGTLTAERSDANLDGSIGREGEQGLRWVPVEVRLPGYEAVNAVAGSNAHLPPASVIRSNIVDQIVRAAKLQVFETGADMTLRLNPPHLGTIHMDVTADQGIVTANLKVSGELTRQVLEADLSMLRQALADTGVNVDAISVSVGDDLSRGWNWHAGPQNGSQHPGNQGGGYDPRRLLEIESEAMVPDGVRSYSTSQFDHLA